MAIKLTAAAIDIGIVTTNHEKMLHFYRDILGIPLEEDRRIQAGLMHRLRCGKTLLKLLQFDNPMTTKAPPGGIRGATGIRYLTIFVKDLDAMLAKCKKYGVPLTHAPYNNNHGLIVSAISDPDGNEVELVKIVPLPKAAKPVTKAKPKAKKK